MTIPIPPGREGLIPHLVCSPCGDAIEFYKRAFGAQEVCRMPGPGGKIMHAELQIGDELLFLADDFPEFCDGKSSSPQALGGTPVTLHRYVEDCDAVIEQTRQAGATVSMLPQDMFWGDRYGKVTDPFGHCWSIATHIRDLSEEEMAQAAQTAMQQS
jgi:PhnB protein